MKRNKLIVLFSVSLSLFSCSKNKEPELLNGHYSGSYYYPSSNVSQPVKSVNVVNLHLDKGNTYNSSAFLDRKPAGGSGEFKVLRNNLVEFTDKGYWTAEFDWGLILNGRFTYDIKGDSLILTRQCLQCSSLPSFYQYRLKRIN